MYLRLKNLDKSYPGEEKPALKSLNLNIKKQQILALLGESGSGKSTLLKIIAGQIQLDKGEYSINEVPVVEKRVEMMNSIEGIDYLDQESEIPPFVSIQNSLERKLIKYESEWSQRRIRKLIKIMRLEGLENKKPEELSGGQRQRAALAITLAAEPELILLDEAFTSMDFQLKHQIQLDLFDFIRKQKITAIVVTHDPNDALKFADKIAVLRKGKIIQKGSPEKIYNLPKTKYTAELFGLVNKVVENESVNFIRPEKVKIRKNKGKIQAEIIHEYFSGSQYLYILKSGNKKFYAYDEKYYKPGNYFIDY